MNIPDAVIIGTVAICGALWARKGLVRGILGLVCFAAAFLVATRYMAAGAVIVDRFVALPNGLGQMVAYMALFFGMLILFKIMLNAVLKIFGLSQGGLLNIVGGLVFGAVIGWSALSLAATMLRVLPADNPVTPHLRASVLYPYVDRSSAMLHDLLLRVYPGFADEYTKLTGGLSGLGDQIPGVEGLGDLRKGIDVLQQSREPQQGMQYSDMFEALGLDSTDEATLDELMKELK